MNYKVNLKSNIKNMVYDSQLCIFVLVFTWSLCTPIETLSSSLSLSNFTNKKALKLMMKKVFIGLNTKKVFLGKPNHFLRKPFRASNHFLTVSG